MKNETNKIKAEFVMLDNEFWQIVLSDDATKSSKRITLTHDEARAIVDMVLDSLKRSVKILNADKEKT